MKYLNLKKKVERIVFLITNKTYFYDSSQSYQL